MVACYTDKVSFELVLLKTTNRTIVSFAHLQAGSDTFCQNGGYLGMADHTEASGPEV